MVGTVAVGIFFEIVLMVCLCGIKYFKRCDLRSDLAVSLCSQQCLIGTFGLLGDLVLIFGSIKQGTAVIVATIIALPISLCRVMQLPKIADQLLRRNPLVIIYHLDRLCMVFAFFVIEPMLQHCFIGRILLIAACISRGSTQHPLQPLKVLLDTPETPRRKPYGLLFRMNGTYQRQH